jgi:hypothetical protein
MYIRTFIFCTNKLLLFEHNKKGRNNMNDRADPNDMDTKDTEDIVPDEENDPSINGVKNDNIDDGTISNQNDVLGVNGSADVMNNNINASNENVIVNHDEGVDGALTANKLVSKNADNLKEAEESAMSETEPIDIEKEVERFRMKFHESPEGFVLSGEPLSRSAMETILDAMEFGIRTARKLNQKS